MPKDTNTRERHRNKSWSATDAAADSLVEAAIHALKAAVAAENVTDGKEDLDGACVLIESARTLWTTG